MDPSGKLTNYTVVSTNGMLNVTAAGLTVTANNASRAYGNTNPAFTGIITGIQNGDEIMATYASAATPASPVGMMIIPTGKDPSGKLTNYTASSSTNGAPNVTAAGLTVTANTLPCLRQHQPAVHRYYHPHPEWGRHHGDLRQQCFGHQPGWGCMRSSRRW